MDLRRSLVEKKISGQSKSASKSASRATSTYTTDDEYDTDDASIASIDSTESFIEANLEQNWETAFNDCVEEILERKGSSVQSREMSLSRLLNFLTLRIPVRELAARNTTLVSAISKMLKSARSEKEALLCIKSLSILYIMSPDNGEIYTTISNALKSALNLSYMAAKAAVLTGMATIILIFDSPLVAQQTIELMVEIIDNDGNSIEAPDEASVVSAAEDALAVSMTVLPGQDSLEDVQLAAPCLIEQLESVDPGVRAAAGECLALFFEMTAVDPEDDEALFNYSKNPPVDDIHHLTQLLAGLATTSSKKQSKSSRREQHQTFREVLATISSPSTNTAPSNTIKFGKARQILYTTTWLQYTRLNHLRSVLGSGLQVYLKRNALVRHLLHYDGPAPQLSDEESDANEDISKDLKNSINQEMKKQRHRDRNAERKEKSAMSSSFVADNDN